MFQTTNQMILPKNNGIQPTHTGNWEKLSSSEQLPMGNDGSFSLGAILKSLTTGKHGNCLVKHVAMVQGGAPVR